MIPVTLPLAMLLIFIGVLAGILGALMWVAHVLDREW